MFHKMFAGLLVTFSVFLGAYLSDHYPSFSLAPNTSQPQPSPIKVSGAIHKEAAFFNLALSSNFRHSLWPLTANNDLGPPPVPLQHLPESEDVPLPEITAKSALSVTENGQFFYQKNPDEKVPIASLTKLITALTVLDVLDPEEITVVSKNAVATYGEMGSLVIGEEISIKNLLYILLIESSNDAAIALAEAVETKNGENFVNLMNAKAKYLKMSNSFFAEPTGLSPHNISTASDLVILTSASLKNSLIEQIIGTQTTDVFSVNKKFCHHLKNTNKLFSKIDNIVGGKTGYTEEAGECMILVVDSPENQASLIHIILGSELGKRFAETEKLIKWTKQTFGW